jgi:hypothetical protein
MLTEKEHFIASELQTQYCLFIVKNFAEKPCHQFFFDPLNSGLMFHKNERMIKQINYSALL